MADFTNTRLRFVALSFQKVPKQVGFSTPSLSQLISLKWVSWEKKSLSVVWCCVHCQKCQARHMYVKIESRDWSAWGWQGFMWHGNTIFWQVPVLARWGHSPLDAINLQLGNCCIQRLGWHLLWIAPDVWQGFGFCNAARLATTFWLMSQYLCQVFCVCL